MAGILSRIEQQYQAWNDEPGSKEISGLALKLFYLSVVSPFLIGSLKHPVIFTVIAGSAMWVYFKKIHQNAVPLATDGLQKPKSRLGTFDLLSICVLASCLEIMLFVLGMWIKEFGGANYFRDLDDTVDRILPAGCLVLVGVAAVAKLKNLDLSGLLGLRRVEFKWTALTVLADSALTLIYGIVTLSLGLTRPLGSDGFVLIRAMPGIVGLILIGVLVPISEELAFRGLLAGYLDRKAGAVWAVTVSAALFAWGHWTSLRGAGPAFVVYIFCSGCLFAWVRLRTGSSYPSIAAHMVINLAILHKLLQWMS